jgi:hypothetical protein
VQRREQQVIGAKHRTRLARLLGGDIEQPLRVGRVRQPLLAAGPASPAAGLEALAHPPGVEPEAGKNRLGGSARLQESEQDVLGPDGVVTQPLGLRPRVLQRPLDRRAQRARVETGNGFGAQSGLASSMSMMGMPSSTA